MNSLNVSNTVHPRMHLVIQNVQGKELNVKKDAHVMGSYAGQGILACKVYLFLWNYIFLVVLFYCMRKDREFEILLIFVLRD